MKNMSGFATYGILVVIAFFSLGTIGYGIATRIREIVYYSELSKQRFVEFDDFTLCGGPDNQSCPDNQTCKMGRSPESTTGICQSQSVQ